MRLLPPLSLLLLLLLLKLLLASDLPLQLAWQEKNQPGHLPLVQLQRLLL